MELRVRCHLWWIVDIERHATFVPLRSCPWDIFFDKRALGLAVVPSQRPRCSAVDFGLNTWGIRAMRIGLVQRMGCRCIYVILWVQRVGTTRCLSHHRHVTFTIDVISLQDVSNARTTQWARRPAVIGLTVLDISGFVWIPRIAPIGNARFACAHVC